MGSLDHFALAQIIVIYRGNYLRKFAIISTLGENVWSELCRGLKFCGNLKSLTLKNVTITRALMQVITGCLIRLESLRLEPEKYTSVWLVGSDLFRQEFVKYAFIALLMLK